MRQTSTIVELSEKRANITLQKPYKQLFDNYDTYTMVPTSPASRLCHPYLVRSTPFVKF
ncbi:hypothetical protein DFP81_101302 [Marinomonas pollencensis]|uniref:Uncharacterized protein n=1 Tax=Marinomonas pollencensis TaxID=491954 RepID=A0A3E0DT52_9GAMM|nr:hypothetical protein DFP81_101302 [Marinomonas pollencensis]